MLTNEEFNRNCRDAGKTVIDLLLDDDNCHLAETNEEFAIMARRAIFKKFDQRRFVRGADLEPGDKIWVSNEWDTLDERPMIVKRRQVQILVDEEESMDVAEDKILLCTLDHLSGVSAVVIIHDEKYEVWS